MRKLETIATADQKMNRCRDVTFENSQAIFLHAFEKLVTHLYTTPRRPEDLVTFSVYDRLSTKGMLVVRRKVTVMMIRASKASVQTFLNDR